MLTTSGLRFSGVPFVFFLENVVIVVFSQVIIMFKQTVTSRVAQ